jgi:hypothetical protein
MFLLLPTDTNILQVVVITPDFDPMSKHSGNPCSNLGWTFLLPTESDNAAAEGFGVARTAKTFLLPHCHQYMGSEQGIKLIIKTGSNIEIMTVIGD